jgi:hypothetical protein
MFSYLAAELRTGDVAVVGSESSANPARAAAELAGMSAAAGRVLRRGRLARQRPWIPGQLEQRLAIAQRMAPYLPKPRGRRAIERLYKTGPDGISVGFRQV